MDAEEILMRQTKCWVLRVPELTESPLHTFKISSIRL